MGAGWRSWWCPADRCRWIRCRRRSPGGSRSRSREHRRRGHGPWTDRWSRESCCRRHGGSGRCRRPGWIRRRVDRRPRRRGCRWRRGRVAGGGLPAGWRRRSGRTGREAAVGFGADATSGVTMGGAIAAMPVVAAVGVGLGSVGVGTVALVVGRAVDGRAVLAAVTAAAAVGPPTVGAVVVAVGPPTVGPPVSDGGEVGPGPVAAVGFGAVGFADPEPFADLLGPAGQEPPPRSQGGGGDLVDEDLLASIEDLFQPGGADCEQGRGLVAGQTALAGGTGEMRVVAYAGGVTANPGLRRTPTCRRRA